MATRVITLLLVVVFVATGSADVPQVRGRLFAARSQRQQLANPTPYPAAGFRPERQFGLPQDQAAQSAPESSQQRPDKLYGAPARQNILPQQQQQQQPQVTYGAPEPAPAPEVETAAVESQRLIAKPARLTSNREDQEDEDETRTDIEVDTNVEEKKTVAVQPAPAPTATIAYYPAGAISFVHPFAAAYSLPGQAAIFGKLQAQPLQPQFLAQPQFLQPQVAPFLGAQLRAW